jgi:acyl-CoA synthetase (AMP-forming)/AMP-acid ligase II
MDTTSTYLKYKNLVEVIQEKQEETTRGITFIEDDEDERFLSYGLLYEKAQTLLYQLQSNGLKPGDELVFQVDKNYNFILTFWACLLGGIIPVPVTTASNDRFKSKLFNIWSSLNNPYLISFKKHLEKLELFAAGDNPDRRFNRIKARTILLNDLEKNQNGKKGVIYYPEGNDIAFIQFSSGSTNQSKGVVLTHKNLLANINGLIKKFNPPGTGDRLLSWMPLTHDMGLICFHLTPTTANWSHFIIPTTLFIRYPSIWLKKSFQHKITITSSPNFGYKHVLRFFNPASMPQVNLSTVRLIVNGAEPISAELCQTFLEEMAPLGLKSKAMFPGYGLAEASVAVSLPRAEQGMTVLYVDRNSIHFDRQIKEVEKENGLSFVEVGTAVEGCCLKIANDSGQEVGDRVIGHILIKGDNVTAGYYNNREATEKAVHADGWLDTGDLGFLRDGQLVITGRVKDTIFANGHTYFAHDIEYAAEDLPGFKLNRTAVVGVFNHQLQMDEIICFVLYRKNQMQEFLFLARELKKWVVKKAGVGISKVIPVKQIPLTSSGKIQRFILKEQYLNGDFDSVQEELTGISQLLIKN